MFAVGTAEALLLSTNDLRILLREEGAEGERELGRLDWPVRDLALSPDGAWAAALSFNKRKRDRRAGTEEEPTGALRVWAVATGEELLHFRPETETLNCIAFLTDGRLVAGADAGLRVWNVPELPLIDTTAPVPIDALGAGVSAFAADRSSSRCALLREDGALELWDLSDPTLPRLRTSIEAAGHALAVSPDGGRAALSSGTTVQQWSLPKFEPTPFLPRHGGAVSAIATGPAGRVATASFDGAVRLWDVGELTLELRGHAGLVYDLDLGPDGRVVSGGQDGTARVWNAARDLGGTEELRVEHPLAVTSVVFVAGGKAFATACSDGGLRIFSTDDGTLLAEAPLGRGVLYHLVAGGELLVGGSSELRAFRLGPFAAGVGDADATLELVELGRLQGARAPLEGLALAAGPAGAKRVAAGFADRSIAVFELDGAELGATDADGNPVALDPVKSWKEHLGRVGALAWSVDGTRLASASTGETAVRIWSVASDYAEERRLEGHDAAVLGLAARPGGGFASAGQDGVVLLWGARSAKDS